MTTSDSPERGKEGNTADVDKKAKSDQEPPPIKKKRGASNQITKVDYEDDDDDGQENEEKLKEGFKRACKEVISKRKIYKVKRSFVVPETAKAQAKNTGQAQNAPSSDKVAAASATTSTSSSDSNPFASTVLASASESPIKAVSTTKKVFGFGSASGFGAATSNSTTGSKSSGFGGGFASVGFGGKASGFGSTSSSATGSTSGFVFGSSSSTTGGVGSGKRLFGNAGTSSITFSLSKNSDNKNSSADTNESDVTKKTKLPDKVDLKTGEEDEETIHSGRCKSFEWIAESNITETNNDSMDSSGNNDDMSSPNKNKTNLSVQSSTQFQAAISSKKSKDASTTGSNNDHDEKDTDKGTKSTDSILENCDWTSAKGSVATVKHRWTELGIGPVKILRSKSNPERLRLVQRRESSKMGPATKVILNVPLWRESTCERDRQALQYLRLKTMKEGKMCQYSLKFKENSDAGYFHHHLTDHIPKARQCFSEIATTTAGKTGDDTIDPQKI